MSNKRKYIRLRKGFSLIELLIVIVIISLVYALGFSSIEWSASKPKALTPLNLKESIINADSFSGRSTFMCLDKCKVCYLRKDLSSAFEEYPNAIDLLEVKSYTIDAQDTLIELEYGRYQDKKICLIIEFYDNKSSSQIILEDKKASYFLPAFFGKAKTFASPEDAKEYWLKNTQILSDTGDFY